eukprot:TRINITY_DN2474_c0_g2_i8.p1 TRINITY_DN2474_c0_g2~~TRINITY_DN2474_c0_g2_i8.p1  ORF type:complete len:486 (+),score=184.57 TRINITY_DN2474_c0_g2_i8:158-1459(+)
MDFNANSRTYNNFAMQLAHSKGSCKKPLEFGSFGNNYNGCDAPTEQMWQINGYMGAEGALRDIYNFDFRLREKQWVENEGAERDNLAIDIDRPDVSFTGPADMDGWAGERERVGARYDAGAYEYGAAEYWMPGPRAQHAMWPVPPMHSSSARVDVDLMWVEGKGAVSHDVYLDTSPRTAWCARRGEAGSAAQHEESVTGNVASLSAPLDEDVWYYWRVDAVGADGVRTKGAEVWCFKVGGEGEFVEKADMPSFQFGNYLSDEEYMKLLEENAPPVRAACPGLDASFYANLCPGETPEPVPKVPEAVAEMHLTIKEDAGTEVKARWGTITDGWDPEYPRVKNALDVSVLGRNCLVTFTALDLEDAACARKDFVQILVTGAGGWLEWATDPLCGHRDADTLPAPVQLSGDGFTVRFKTSKNDHFSGFALEYVCQA